MKPNERHDLCNINRDPCLWNDVVEMKIREKKHLYHKVLDDKKLANWQKLDTRDGENDLYRLVKSRNERTQDIEHFFCVNDKNGTLLTNRQAAKDRWRCRCNWCSEVAVRKTGRQPCRPNQNQVAEENLHSGGTGRRCTHFGFPAVMQ